MAAIVLPAAVVNPALDVAIAVFIVALVVDGRCRCRCWNGAMEACSTSPPSGNQVDGLPLVAHTGAGP